MSESHNGLLVIDKPSGITSRDAVNRVQRRFPKGTPIGHTGTLDPLATGVLVLCIGAATRLAEYVQRMRKVYQAGLTLGATSDTDDADGVITPAENIAQPNEADVRQALSQLEGEQDQIPPIYSASKVGGRRAYKLARRGLEVELQPRRITIYTIRILAYRHPNLDVEVECSKGTYIRSLARDLGKRLGCGAYIRSLRRTRVGPFDVASASALDADPPALLPMQVAVSELPRVTVAEEAIKALRQGQALSEQVVTGPTPTAEMEAAAFDNNNNLIAVMEWSPKINRWRPVKVLNGSYP